MASRFQAAPLAASPVYPNAIAWSEENLIAVACGHLVIILNPALPQNPALSYGSRGLITVPTCNPYPIGLVKSEDLLAECLLPTALCRDRRPYVRSISWSPLGLASNGGCLLAVCTTEGRVKLYGQPYSEFCAEWVEVMDLSDKLYDYLVKSNVWEPEMPDSECYHEQTTELGCTSDHANFVPNSISKKERKRGRDQVPNGMGLSVAASNSEKPHAGRSSYAKMKGGKLKAIDCESDKRKRKFPEACSLPRITANQYASRSAMLSLIAVAWSPLLCFSSKTSSASENTPPHKFSIIAVGGKSGSISLWRIDAPQSYSVEHSQMPATMMLVGFIQAHDSWVTAINLAVLGSNSNPQVLLASGSSDGSVKIWSSNSEKLLDTSDYNDPPFFLLKEVISSNNPPVSVLSLQIPVQILERVLLAVGKGSGSFEIWTCDISSCKFSKAGLSDRHECIVTGLAWAFEGCLYSCGQDNYVHCWLLRGNSLCEVPFPSNTPGLTSSTDLPDTFLSCLGLAVSPGNLAIAMVRNVDGDLLDPMYEARTFKAVVEFFWIGGQQWDPLSNTSLELANESFFGFSEKELAYWESSILWSLKKIENSKKPQVMWDSIAALLAFKKLIPEYVNHILAKWLSITYLGSHMNLSVDEILMRISINFPKVTSRLLHLLNIICRCLVLSELNSDEINRELDLREPTRTMVKGQSLWMELLFRSEKELRQRLVSLSFYAILVKTASQPGYWYPIGVAQMEQWVELNCDHIKDQLKVLTEGLWKQRRLSSVDVEEQCSYCSASVPFNSPEIASCRGLEQNHKLARCAVSMQVCPVKPLWFCKCCSRQISKLAPEALFTMARYPQDFKSLMDSSCLLEKMSKPLCPFCGILLQRLQPDFLLSASPV
ncbi:uncharacterized protein LOC126685889 [Mercurialis annua]|uniref:uncharacterized protein LOC126685889 n=1 Tax=Mercurialis annua TaxID=3986 RepID=UPI00215F5B7A|nr:uncharacterized protein LOC126685889 [Mercurialis annua]